MNYTIKPPIHSAREAVYHTLKGQILSNELLPGTSISEKEMSIQFGVSRTPVRESFVRLSQEGLLDIYPQRGTVVSLIDLELVEEARFMREQLECAVIRLACLSFPSEELDALQTNLILQRKCVAEQDYKKMFEYDEAFHRTLFKGCSKLNTWAVIQQINVHLNRTRMLRLAADHHWDDLFTQHQQMVEAIQESNVVWAEKVMSEHMHLTILDQALLKQKFPTYFK
ncbi:MULTISPECIES: GntR family transcriptional regulator [unclassified Paenibacillus]|uniref:GntR family transcriptional regulator n=1 Tax=unclassified Paenibacillus TaxID=185978 RepID=UPI00277F2FC7|nr:MULTISPECIES: GntR family transcriptional regulator [unclassified Paenibacillus]MDQ0900893.1 DNA-binding GntR family transcriptional regulator [Paenibacillus sp. V4I7]MDQ0920609.1 DNA-binding GntR family transcriptional regulator [Paenibacillus sp. V4I5]